MTKDLAVSSDHKIVLLPHIMGNVLRYKHRTFASLTYLCHVTYEQPDLKTHLSESISKMMSIDSLPNIFCLQVCSQNKGGKICFLSSTTPTSKSDLRAVGQDYKFV